MKFVQSLKDFVFSPLHVIRHALAIVFSKVFLSNRGKRMLLAASLYAHLKTFDVSDNDYERLAAIAHDINQLFLLVNKSERALVLPILMHDWIWREIDIPNQTELKNMSVRRSCNKIIKRVPSWLRYNDKVMSDDISLIVRRHIGRHLTQ